MKKLPYALTLLCWLTNFCVLAQTTAPVVPEQVKFADILVHFDPDARRIVQQDVNALLANRQYWTAKLDRVVLYFPMIEAIFIEEDVPTDFKYLAVQESSLTPDAVSSSMAVGYWQFKRETAMSYGMRVDDDIDERKNIVASTHGAAKYLKKSNAQFNNWVASLYSYYLGAGGIAKLIPPDWSYAREVALDGRTDRYILRFFAHKIAVENALQTHQTNNRFALIEYPGGGGKSMRAIADELGVDEFELRKYNRWMQGDAVPTDKAYVLAVPVANDQINDVRQKIQRVIPAKTPDFARNDVGFPVLRRVTTGGGSSADPVLYEINGLPGIQAQASDNASSLARKSKISLSSFLRYNDMSERDPTITGDVYYLAKKRKKALVPFHTVREDETARSISQRYGIRLKKLMRYNRLDRVQKLAVGRVMWLRQRRPANKPVEVISAPTPPVYDPTPVPPSPTTTSPDVAARTPGEPNRPVNGLNDVPRNASERKVYQPKLVGGGVTPNDGWSAPATPDRPAPTAANRPASVTTSRSVPVSPAASNNNEGSQRVVIVRTPDAPTKAVPVATAPERDKVTAAGSSASGSPDARTPDEGPREQQADGSITVPPTKAPPRPAAPGSLDTQPAKSVATTPDPKSLAAKPAPSAEPKPVSPSPSAINRSAAPPVSNPRSDATHTVEPGQTYYSVSKLYGLTVDELLALNNLTTNDVLEVGQKLIVKPTVGRVVQPSKSAVAAASSPGNVVYHTVVKGETMFRISKNYGVTIEQIQQWNNLGNTGVNEGQKLKIIRP